MAAVVSEFGGPVGAKWGENTRSGGRRLLCAMCSAKKADAHGGRLMLEDLYGPGAVVNSLARVPRASWPDILFLSAELGLGRHDAWASPYERLMDAERAETFIGNPAMREQFANTLRSFAGGQVLIAAGGLYRMIFASWIVALNGDARLKAVTIHWAPPPIGLMRQAVRWFALEMGPYAVGRESWALERAGETRQETGRRSHVRHLLGSCSSGT